MKIHMYISFVMSCELHDFSLLQNLRRIISQEMNRARQWLPASEPWSNVFFLIIFLFILCKHYETRIVRNFLGDKTETRKEQIRQDSYQLYLMLINMKPQHAKPISYLL